jgi:hypothetical protein
MNVIASLKQSFRNLLGVKIENRHERPDMQQVESAIQQVESAIVISRLFQSDAMRQQLDHEISIAGGIRRVDDNSRHLGRI